MEERHLEQSEALQEQLLNDAIQRARTAASENGLPYTGHCHNCGDITGGARRFFDQDCRQDYDTRKASERRAGR